MPLIRRRDLDLYCEQSHPTAKGVVEGGEVAPGHPVVAGQGDGFLASLGRSGAGLCRPGPFTSEGGALVDAEGVGGSGAEGGRWPPVQVVVAPQQHQAVALGAGGDEALDSGDVLEEVVAADVEGALVGQVEPLSRDGPAPALFQYLTSMTVDRPRSGRCSSKSNRSHTAESGRTSNRICRWGIEQVCLPSQGVLQVGFAVEDRACAGETGQQVAQARASDDRRVIRQVGGQAASLAGCATRVVLSGVVSRSPPPGSTLA